MKTFRPGDTIRLKRHAKAGTVQFVYSTKLAVVFFSRKKNALACALFDYNGNPV